MRIRLLGLFAFSLLLIGLMSLLVVSAGDAPLPPSPERQALVALPMAAPVSAQPDDLPLPRLPVVSVQTRAAVSLAGAPMSDANGLPLGGGSYAEAAHAAFHYSDEAG